MFIFGDFNAPHINWCGNNVSKGNRSLDFRLLEVVNDCFFIQHVDFSTREIHGQPRSTLDLVLTNGDDSISNVTRIPPIGKSDHCGIVCQLNVEMSDKFDQKLATKMDWYKADFGSIRSQMASKDWNEEFAGLSANEMYQKLSFTVDNLTKLYVPIKQVKNSSGVQWQTNRSRRLICKKAAAYRRFQQSRSGTDYSKYAAVRNATTKAIRQDRRSFESKIANKSSKNPRKLFAYLRNQTKGSRTITIQKQDGTLMADEHEVSTALNDHFSSVFTRERDGPLPVFANRVDCNNHLCNIIFREIDIHCKLLQLIPGKSPGPDSIYPHFLKECAAEICKPLALLFTKSMSEGSIQDA